MFFNLILLYHKELPLFCNNDCNDDNDDEIDSNGDGGALVRKAEHHG